MGLSTMPLLFHFIFSFIATVGFSIFLNTPKKSLVYAGLTGAVGWSTYVYLYNVTGDAVFPNFIAASLVGIMSESLARIVKTPAIIFVIPGIIPLVPGVGMYNAMLYFINENYEMAISTGITALLVGGAISLGVLLVTSIAKTISSIKRKSQNLSR